MLPLIASSQIVLCIAGRDRSVALRLAGPFPSSRGLGTHSRMHAGLAFAREVAERLSSTSLSVNSMEIA